MRRYLTLLDQEMCRLPERSEMDWMVRSACDTLRHRLTAAMDGWEVWKRLLPETLRWDGYDKARLYEIAVLNHMDRNNAFLMDRLLECDHLRAQENFDELTVEVYNELGPTATILFGHDEDCRQQVTYEDPEFDVKITHKLWSYDLMGHEPSFK